jgi:hypothetical protein
MLDDDPVGGRVAAFLLPPRGLAAPLRPVSLSPYLSKTKKSVCRLACALLLIRSIDQDGRSRRRWCGSPFSLTIALMGAQASLESSERVGGSISGSLKPRCPQGLRTPATLVARRWTSPRLGSWKEGKMMASS